MSSLWKSEKLPTTEFTGKVLLLCNVGVPIVFVSERIFHSEFASGFYFVGLKHKGCRGAISNLEVRETFSCVIL